MERKNIEFSADLSFLSILDICVSLFIPFPVCKYPKERDFGSSRQIIFPLYLWTSRTAFEVYQARRWVKACTLCITSKIFFSISVSAWSNHCCPKTVLFIQHQLWPNHSKCNVCTFTNILLWKQTSSEWEIFMRRAKMFIAFIWSNICNTVIELSNSNQFIHSKDLLICFFPWAYILCQWKIRSGPVPLLCGNHWKR